MTISKEKIKSLLTDGIVVFSSKIAGALGSLFLVYILTNNLSPEEYGILTLAMTFSIVINQLLIGPLGAGSTRFLAAAIEHKESSRYISVIFNFLKKINIIIFILGLILIIVLYTLNIEKDWIYIIFLMILFTIISGYYSIFNGFFLALKKQLSTSIHQALESWLKAIFAFLCIYIFGDTGLIAVIGYILGMIILAVSQVLLFNNVKLEKENSNNEEWDKKVFNYSYPFMIWGIFTAIHLISDRWVLQIYSSTAEVGMYSVVYQLGYFPVILLISVLVQVITPHFFQMAGIGVDKNRMLKIRQTQKYLIFIPLTLTLFISIALFLLEEVIFDYIVATEYHSVSYLLPYMAIAAGVFATGQTLTLILQSESESSMLIKPKIGTAILGVLLNVVGGILFGIDGIVCAMILYSLIYLIWISLIIKYNIYFRRKINE